jgi:hypothetical protein
MVVKILVHKDKNGKFFFFHNTIRANVIGFDHEAEVQRNLPIVSAITAVYLPDGISVLLIVHEAIYDDTANHQLLSEFQRRDFGLKVDSICHRASRLYDPF